MCVAMERSACCCCCVVTVVASRLWLLVDVGQGILLLLQQDTVLLFSPPSFVFSLRILSIHAVSRLAHCRPTDAGCVEGAARRGGMGGLVGGFGGAPLRLIRSIRPCVSSGRVCTKSGAIELLAVQLSTKRNRLLMARVSSPKVQLAASADVLASLQPLLEPPHRPTATLHAIPPFFFL